MEDRVKRRAVLSGGIGSGKSTVGALLAARGALVIDSDEVGHEVLEPGGAAFARVSARWPTAVRDGSIDRAALAATVFDDPAQLAELEGMTHPAIRCRIDEMVAAADAPVVVVELPVPTDLLGSGWPRIVVAVPAEVRLARLQARGMDVVDAVRRMAAQPTDDEWRAIADYVVDNTGDPASLESLMDGLWEFLVTPGR